MDIFQQLGHHFCSVGELDEIGFVMTISPPRTSFFGARSDILLWDFFVFLAVRLSAVFGS
jgi:hypothetical protein